MKRLFKISIWVLLLAISTLNVNGESRPKFNLNETKMLVIDLNDWNNTDVTIEIRDLDGEILHIDFIEKGQTSARRYNLKNLPNGEYKIIIEGGSKKSINTFSVEFDEVKMFSENEQVIYKPNVVKAQDYVDMNFLAQGEYVRVSIVDDSGEVFSKEYSDMVTINKRFDVSRLPKGEYVFVVNADNQYFTKRFRK